MYEALKSLVVRILKVPAEPPEEPAGRHESVRVFRASPRFLSYLIVGWAIGMGAAGIAIFGGVMTASVALVAAGYAWAAVVITVVAVVFFVVKVAVFYVTTRLNYEMRWYVVTDRSLRIREGVFLVREVTLTFANVQNISVSQGPLQRYFGISDVVVETAGGGAGGGGKGAEGLGMAHHGVLRGIENATEVKEAIQALLRSYKAAGLGDPEEKAGTGGAGLVGVLKSVAEECRLLRAAVAGPS